MKIYNKYLVKNFFYPFFISTFTLTIVMISMRILRYLYFINKFNANFFDILQMTFFALLSSVFLILPLILFLTIIFVYNKFLETRELIILKNCGLTKFQLLSPVAFISIIIALLSFFIGVYFAPKSYYNIAKIKNKIINNVSISIIKEKNFISLQNFTIYAEKKENEILTNVLIYNTDREKNLLLQAKTAIISNANIKLLEGTMQETLIANKEEKFIFFDEYVVSLNDFIKMDNNNESSYSTYSYPTLMLINAVKKKYDGDYFEELVKRFLYPLLSFILPALAGVMVLNSDFNRVSNTKNTIQITLTCLVVFVISYFLLSNISNTLIYFYLFVAFLVFLFGVLIHLTKEKNNM
ncbi:MAG: hypothetical protein Ta2D_04060 [Rickettsiales bacterium]|nr:MAG: hypothetical protein Ta2D_04060 [Rickettsiales bacterium]